MKLSNNQKLFDFAQKYQLFNSKFLGKSRFFKFQKILLSLFTVCFFLLVAQFFGFSFGFDWWFLLILFSLLFLVLSIWEIRKRWTVVYPEIKNRFLEKREAIQEKIIARSPKKLISNRNSISLILAGILVFWDWFWRNAVLLGAVLGVIADVFVFKSSSDLLILFLVILWVLSIKYFRLKEEVSVVGGLAFLFICPFLLVFEKETIAEKAAIWAYVFLAVGVIQTLIEYMRENRKWR